MYDVEAAGSSLSTAQRAPSPPGERRSLPRYYVTKSAIAIPVRPDLTPDQSHGAEGFTYDLGDGGLGFEAVGLDQLPGELIVVGIEGDDGHLYFATIQVCHWSNLAGRVRIGGRFASGCQDLLRPENLIPRYRTETRAYETGLPTETLYKWGELGILCPMLVDRLLVCPQCGSLPSFRTGCRSCGSIHIASQQLIHHLVCSYVGTTREFKRNGELRCPKCLKEELVEGDDFEYLSGPRHCLDCNWSDSGTETFGRCLECQASFPLHGAAEKELVGFHVNRIEPQTLLRSPSV